MQIYSKFNNLFEIIVLFKIFIDHIEQIYKILIMKINIFLVQW